MHALREETNDMRQTFKAYEERRKKDALMKITKLPAKYYTVLLNLEQVNPRQRWSKEIINQKLSVHTQDRNENAHETDEEMARLLLSKYEGMLWPRTVVY